MRDVERRSRGRFKPSALGGYERGERSISVERFCELASVYGVPADRLLAQVMEDLTPESRRQIVIDLTRLSLLPEEEGRRVSEFVHVIKARRGDYLTDVITLRAGDLEALSHATGKRPKALLERLAPALRSARTP